MLGTLIGAALPIVTAVVGVGVGVTASLAFSGVVDMASVTPVLGVMLGLAVGIDYSLFIVNRHRKQLLNGVPVRESIGLATGTSGTAVVFAGTTVIVASHDLALVKRMRRRVRVLDHGKLADDISPAPGAQGLEAGTTPSFTCTAVRRSPG